MNLSLLKKNPRLLLMGFATNFLSGFGQSFFLSLFTPKLLEELNLTNSEYGLIYSTATLLSGLILPYHGHRLNYQTPQKFIFVSFAGFALFCLSFLYISHPFHLWFTLFGLRFFGQGMLTHIGATIISARFLMNRGKALSFTNLGFPASEALLPILVVWYAGVTDIATIWAYCALAVLLFSLVTPLLLKEGFESQRPSEDALSFKFREFTGMKSFTFWYYALPSILPAFILTALFLYHGVILQERGLPLHTIAESYVFFAAARVISSLSVGVLIDKFGSRFLFPLYLTPLMVGLIILAFIQGRWGFLVYLTLGGVTQGAASNIMNSVWTEIYGPKSLARIRSNIAALAVSGTAAGPFLFGLLIDTPLDIRGGILVLLSTMVVIFIGSLMLKKRYPSV